jgi:hypothetical protein
MDGERYSNDQVEQILGHLFSGLAVFHAGICEWLIEVDRGQRFLADGGPTDLGNLILLCGYHHRFVHEHGWGIQESPDRTPVFTRPDGREYPPPRPRLDPRLRQLVGLRT